MRVVAIAAVLLVAAALAVDLQRTPQELALEPQPATFAVIGTYERTPAEAPPLCLPNCAGERHDLRMEVRGLPALPIEARLDGRVVPLDGLISRGDGPGPQRLELAWPGGPVWHTQTLAPGLIDEAVTVRLLAGVPDVTVEQLGSIAVALTVDIRYQEPVPGAVELHVWLDDRDVGVLDESFDDRIDGVRLADADLVISIEPVESMPAQPTFIAWA
ncbi:MAG: hypothetical protein ACPHID_02115 [Thermoplasmatota archaeon]